jgi:hypothetical protein
MPLLYQNWFYVVTIIVLQILATCQLVILHESGTWHTTIEPTAAVVMSLRIFKILAVLIKSARSRQKK